MELCDKANWEPDAASKYCRGCSKSFGFALRRSHCRVCGKVYCGDCVHHLDFTPSGAGGPSESVKACRKCSLAHAAFCEEVRQNGGLPPETAMAVETDVAPASAGCEPTHQGEQLSVEERRSTAATEASNNSAHPRQSASAPAASAEARAGSTPKTAAATTTTAATPEAAPVSSGGAASSSTLATTTSPLSQAPPPPPPPIVLVDKRKWEQDSHVARCHDCNVGFSFQVRRSHCRLCGRVYCKNCVSGVSLPEVAPNESLKVCRDCNKTYLQPRGRSAFETTSQTLSGLNELQSSDDDDEATAPTTAGAPAALGETTATVLQQDSGAFAKTDHVSKIKFCDKCGKILQPGTKTCATCNPAPPTPLPAAAAADSTPNAEAAAAAPSEAKATATDTPPSAPDRALAEASPNHASTTAETTSQSTSVVQPSSAAANPDASAKQNKDDCAAASCVATTTTSSTAAQPSPSSAPQTSESCTTEQPPVVAPETSTNTATTESTSADAAAPASAPQSDDAGHSAQSTADSRAATTTTPPAPSEGEGDGSPAATTTTTTSAAGAGGDGKCSSNGSPASQPTQLAHNDSFASSSTLNGSVVLSDDVVRNRSISIRQDADGAKLTARCARFLEGREIILRVQSVTKSRYLRSQTRILVLTTQPRLFYVDEGNVLRGSLSLSVGCGSVKLDGKKGFVVTMNNSDGQVGKAKDYNFTTETPEDAGAWVADIESIIKGT